MLQHHLRRHAEALDERSYRVRFPADVDREANSAFFDGDSYTAEWLGQYWTEMFRLKLRALGVRLPPGARVLDCCCGLGYLGETLRVDYGAQVVFADISSTQLDALHKRLEREGSPTPRTKIADLMALPFPDESFDALVGNSFLHHLRDVPRALSEMRRVLRPGGLLLLFHEPSATADYWESFPLSLIKDTATEQGFTDLWMFEPADLTRLASEAGFGESAVHRSGLLPALFLNWLLIVAHKLGAESRPWGRHLYRLRVALSRAEWSLPDALRRRGPSLTLAARKPGGGRL